MRLIFLISFFVLLFLNILMRIFSPIGFFDELFSIGSFILLLYLIKKYGYMKKKTLIILNLMYAFLLVGLFPNILNDYQKPFIMLADGFLMLKGFLVLLLMMRIDQQYIDFIQEKWFNLTIQSISAVTILLAILNYIFGFFDIYGVRYGIKAQQLMFTHPYMLGVFIIALISILLFNMQYEKKNIYFIVALCLISFLTVRLKIIVTIIVLFLVGFAFALGLIKRLRIWHFLLLGGVAILIGWQRIQNQFIIHDMSPRAIKYAYSLIIANDYFPIGSGFGTFASYLSGKYYSGLYSDYGITGIYGMVPQNYKNISDSFIPMLFGETGYLGILIYGIIVFMIFLMISKTAKVNKYIYLASFLIIINLLIASFSNSSFAHYYAVLFMFLLGIYLNFGLKTEDNKPRQE